MIFFYLTNVTIQEWSRNKENNWSWNYVNSARQYTVQYSRTSRICFQKKWQFYFEKELSGIIEDCKASKQTVAGGGWGMIKFFYPPPAPNKRIEALGEFKPIKGPQQRYFFKTIKRVQRETIYCNLISTVLFLNVRKIF